MYFVVQGLVAPGPFGATDRVQQHHAVIGQAIAALRKETSIERRADILEHADRDDPVKPPLDTAVVEQLEPDAICHPGTRRGSRATSCSALSVIPSTSTSAISWR
jgi:hypothetical protein